MRSTPLGVIMMTTRLGSLKSLVFCCLPLPERGIDVTAVGAKGRSTRMAEATSRANLDVACAVREVVA